MYIVQRIYEGAGKDKTDIRETLIVNCGNPDSALEKIKGYFDDDEDYDVTYNKVTKRFSIIPKSRPDLLYHIVADNEVDVIDKIDILNEINEANNGKDS